MCFSRTSTIFVACCALIWSASSSTSLAQHSDVFVYQRDGTLVPTSDGAEQKVFSRLFDFFGHPFGNTGLPKAFIANDPGFQTNSSPTATTSLLPVGEILYGDFLPFRLPGGETGNALHWGLSGDVSFDSVPDDHFFNVSDVSPETQDVQVLGDTTKVEDVVLGLVSGANEIHEHITWRLDDGDGNTNTDPARGIYMMMMQVKMDGLETSDPFAVLLSSTDVSVSEQSMAESWVSSQFDAISILGESLLGDFDTNGVLGTGDIDALVAQVATRGSDASFDLTGDGDINLDDVDAWRSLAGEANLGSPSGYQLGDANLDGAVDSGDFVAWNANRFTSVAAWSAGDFTADGFIDISDFNVWNANRSVSANQSTVPEPASRFSMLFGLAVIFFRSATRIKTTR